MDNEKRMINEFEVLQAIRFGGAEYILAEDKSGKSEEPYMTFIADRNNPLGIESYTEAYVSSSYFEIFDLFINKIAERSKGLQKERKEHGLPNIMLTAEDCILGGLNKDLEGQLVIIKSNSLSPEYRMADRQLVIAKHGFGCAPNSRGNAVYCKNLYSGKESRFEKYDIAGIADLEKLPEWSRLKIEEMKKSADIKLPEKDSGKKSLLGSIEDGKKFISQKSSKNNNPKRKKEAEI